MPRRESRCGRNGIFFGRFWDRARENVVMALGEDGRNGNLIDLPEISIPAISADPQDPQRHELQGFSSIYEGTFYLHF
jgi:hypothetical protein